MKYLSRFATYFIRVMGCLIIGCSPGFQQQVARLKAQIQGSGDDQRLRKWAVELMEKSRASAVSETALELSKTDAPQWITSLGSPFPFHGISYFPATKKQDEYIAIVWASGRGGLGMRIGGKTYKAVDLPNELYWIEAFPGIYIFTSTKD